MMDSPSVLDSVDNEHRKTSVGDNLVSSIITTIHSTVQDEVTIEDDRCNDRSRRIDSVLFSLDASCSSDSTDDDHSMHPKTSSTDHQHTTGDNSSHNHDHDVEASSSLHSTSLREEQDTEGSQQSTQQPLTQNDLKSLVVNHILHVLNTGSYEEVTYCRRINSA